MANGSMSDGRVAIALLLHKDGGKKATDLLLLAPHKWPGRKEGPTEVVRKALFCPSLSMPTHLGGKYEPPQSTGPKLVTTTPSFHPSNPLST